MTQRDLFDKKQPPEPVTYTHYPDVSIPANKDKSYHKTTALKPGEHAERTAKAKSQDEKVLEFFQKNPEQAWTADQVWQLVMPDSPVTSARRACTNLMTAGILKKLAATRIGLYGAQCHYYRLVQK